MSLSDENLILKFSLSQTFFVYFLNKSNKIIVSSVIPARCRDGRASGYLPTFVEVGKYPGTCPYAVRRHGPHIHCFHSVVVKRQVLDCHEVSSIVIAASKAIAPLMKHTSKSSNRRKHNFPLSWDAVVSRRRKCRASHAPRVTILSLLFRDSGDQTVKKDKLARRNY